MQSLDSRLTTIAVGLRARAAENNAPDRILVTQVSPEVVVHAEKAVVVDELVVHKATKHGTYADKEKRREYMRVFMANKRAAEKHG